MRPTLIISDNPRQDIFTTEYFGPILALHVYDDADFEATLTEVDAAASYGADRGDHRRREGGPESGESAATHAAGNSSWPTRAGAVVGQQPSGAPGARAPTTRPALWNLIRWSSPRSIKRRSCRPSRPRSRLIATCGSSTGTSRSLTQSLIGVLEVEHYSDRAEIEAFGNQLGDAPHPRDVVAAVEASPASRPTRLDQAGLHVPGDFARRSQPSRRRRRCRRRRPLDQEHGDATNFHLYRISNLTPILTLDNL